MDLQEYHNLMNWIELVKGNIYRKPWFSSPKLWLSCRFSLKPVLGITSGLAFDALENWDPPGASCAKVYHSITHTA